MSEIEKLRAENATMREALECVHRYFMAAAKAWAINEGRVVNDDGHVIVEAEGLDELADEAGAAVVRALKMTEASVRAEAHAMMNPV